MGNCLKTQLKESVSSNLPKLGEYIFSNPNDGARYFYLAKEEGVASLITPKSGNIYIGNPFAAKPSTPISEPTSFNGSAWVWADAESSFSVSDYYSLITINGTTANNHTMYAFINAKDFNYLTNPKNIWIRGGKTSQIDLSKLTNMVQLWLYDDLDFDTSILTILNNSPKLANFRCDSGNQTPYTLAQFGAAAPDTLINWWPNGNTGVISGDLVDLVVAQRNKNRTSGTLWIASFGNNYTVVTFNGNAVTPTASELTWTANTITFQGTTVNA